MGFISPHVLNIIKPSEKTGVCKNEKYIFLTKLDPVIAQWELFLIHQLSQARITPAYMLALNGRHPLMLINGVEIITTYQEDTTDLTSGSIKIMINLDLLQTKMELYELLRLLNHRDRKILLYWLTHLDYDPQKYPVMTDFPYMYTDIYLQLGVDFDSNIEQYKRIRNYNYQVGEFIKKWCDDLWNNFNTIEI